MRRKIDQQAQAHLTCSRVVMPSFYASSDLPLTVALTNLGLP
jgi:hypothetical protein